MNSTHHTRIACAVCSCSDSMQRTSDPGSPYDTAELTVGPNAGIALNHGAKAARQQGMTPSVLALALKPTVTQLRKLVTML